jgi:sulfur carrier protein ThiS
MQIRVRLMGLLKNNTPDGGVLALGDNATIADALEQLRIASKNVHVFTVNGQLVRDRNHRLAAGDELAVLSPVGGG